MQKSANLRTFHTLAQEIIHEQRLLYKENELVIIIKAQHNPTWFECNYCNSASILSSKYSSLIC